MPLGQEMPSHYHGSLVALSVAIAVMASYAALDLAGRVTASRGRLRALWLGGGAVAMGSGIWSMHYIGMLAFHLPFPVVYDIPTAVLSLLAAILASAIALGVVSCRRMSYAQVLPGSLAMGLGISAMHYLGMASMRLPGIIRYRPGMVLLSVAIAVVVSMAALWLAFHFRGQSPGRFIQKSVSAVAMGAAIASMHYVGMAAARFHAAPDVAARALGVDLPVLGTGGIAALAILMLGVVIVTSIADRRFARQAELLQSSEGVRRAQEQFLRTVLDINPALIFAKDWDGRFTLANKAVAAVYGTTPEGLIGKRDADFSPSDAEVESFVEQDRAVMLSGRTVLINEEPVTSAAGETRWYQTIKVPVPPAEGMPQQVLGVATDISHRKRLEEQLRQAQKMEAVGQLAGGIAHDFNNILTAILGNTAMLIEDLTPGDRGREDLQDIHRAAERAADLTQQLLAFSRKQVLQPRVLDLNVLVGDVRRLLDRVITERVELRVVAAAGLGMVEADPGQLEQVLMNLVVNARDAMPAGGVITIETGNTTVASGNGTGDDCLTPGSWVSLSVSDTGTGMSPDVRARIFEPFFTTKGPGRGTGLGLATVYGIVRQSGGCIAVDSTEGRGTTFRIHLPRVHSRADASAPAMEESVRGGTETVLVAEDEEAVRTLTQRVLEQYGYTVLAGASGSEAIALAEAHDGPIHLLVSDVVMPKMGGKELAQRLGAVQSGLKVLFVSGHVGHEMAEHGVLQAGVVLLRKPFGPRALARKVREVLES